MRRLPWIGTFVTLLSVTVFAEAGLPNVFCPFILGEETAEISLIRRMARPTFGQVASRYHELNWKFINETLFVVPHNDGESWRASAILEAIGAPHLRLSRQKWGAKFELEKIPRNALDGVKRILTFEMPGPEAEAAFRARGYEIVVIDHHVYEGLNRYRTESSLEQLCEKIGWRPTPEDGWISVNDRSFVPGMKSAGLSVEAIRTIRRFDYLAQGNTYGKLKADAVVAEVRAGELVPQHGYYSMIDEDVAFVREALAIKSPDGVVNVFEVDRRGAGGRLGFSGDPRVVDALLGVDFTKFGYEKGSFAAYSVGNPPSKLYGFKPKSPPRGSDRLVPDAVVEAIENLIRKTLGP